MRFLRPRQVADMLGVSRTTLWRMVRAGAFPHPVRITAGSCGFLLETVETWMRARAEASPWRRSEKERGAREAAAGSERTKLALARRP